MELRAGHSRNRARIAIGAFFFIHGFCFSSWTSRIPDLQQKLALSEPQLGTLLFALPVGSMLSLTFSSQLIAGIGSQRVLPLAMTCYAAALSVLGAAANASQLAFALLIFGIAGNLVNVSVNTQAVGVERIFHRQIMAGFHGLWSLAGFFGAALGAIMMAQGVRPLFHFLISSATILVTALLSLSSLLIDSPRDHLQKKSTWEWPDTSLLLLGVITFCSMMCEGAMFDWSGVYFEKVVLAKEGWIAAGYVAFMSTMAGTRFIADRLKEKLGFTRVLQLCGIFIAAGLSLSIAFPTLGPALLGFLLVGAGTSAVVPFTYSEAGRGSKRSAGAAITVVSAVGFLGFLFGPPLIGWIAGATNLRVSFAVIVLFAVAITGFVTLRARRA